MDPLADPPGDYSSDPCRWYWYKDPGAIPSRHWERYGLHPSQEAGA